MARLDGDDLDDDDAPGGANGRTVVADIVLSCLAPLSGPAAEVDPPSSPRLGALAHATKSGRPFNSCLLVLKVEMANSVASGVVYSTKACPFSA
mmetsp:Transcript_11150/g.26821  ORF Transcript_11150/g.26821 Transcript_11150/m.26821 type:complete len:94 (-) Transcript_11150:912-1193(-)